MTGLNKRSQAYSRAVAGFIPVATFTVLAATLVMEWGMEQVRPLGARHFEIDGKHYLAVAGEEETTFSNLMIFRWTGSYFAEFQRFLSPKIHDLEYFQIEGAHYLVAASSPESSLFPPLLPVLPRPITPQKMYRWMGASFAEFQNIANVEVFDWEHFEMDGSHYLLAAESFGAPQVYQWAGTSFAEFQRIPTIAASDSKHFEIDGTHYLALSFRHSLNVSWSASSDNSQIFQWTGTSFIEFQTLPSGFSVDLEYFRIDGAHFLAIANIGTHKVRTWSKIFRWTGTSFVEFQRITTYSAVAWKHAEVDGSHYLLAVNHGQRDSCNGATSDNSDFVPQHGESRMYRWTGVSFVEFQRIRSKFALGIDHFEIDDSHYLMVLSGYVVSSMSERLWGVNSKVFHHVGDSFQELQSIQSSSNLLVIALLVVVLVQFACWFQLRRWWQRRCSAQSAYVAQGGGEGGAERADAETDASLESRLSTEALRAAERRFQDELARESVAWLGLFVCACTLVFDVNLVYALVLYGARDKDKPTSQESVKSGFGLVLLLALWLACRFGFKQEGSKRSGIRRVLLCFPVPVSYVAAVMSDRTCKRVILNSSDDWSPPRYGTLLGLVFVNSFVQMMVAPASPGTMVSTVSALLYTVVMAWCHSMNPTTQQEDGVWQQFALAMILLISFPFIKRGKERMHRKMLLALQWQSSLVTMEKVERCKAEFRFEGVRKELAQLAPGSTKADPRAPSIATSQSRSARSAMTAPVATWSFFDQRGMKDDRAAGSAAPCEGPDCLPENSLVQVEGSSDPQELGAVQVGDRILCSDSLINRACYVEVISTEIVDEADVGPVGWVRLRLSDGTFMTMTEDHPVRVHGRSGEQTVKLAGEVQAKRDDITSLRFLQNTVVEVEHGVIPTPVSHGDDTEGPPRRVSLSVQQGGRYSILVSPPGCSASPLTNLSAVGSADATRGGLLQSRTFLDYGVEAPQLRRTVSDSQLVCKFSTIARLIELQPQTGPGAAADDVEHILAELTEACRAPILNLLLDHHEELQLDLGEYWSKGSELHSSGICHPCASFNWKTGCAEGRDCEHCHIPHFDKGGARPNAFKRRKRAEFYGLTRGIAKVDGGGSLQSAVRLWTGESQRFRELLLAHAAPLLETARGSVGSAAASSSDAPASSSDARPASAPGIFSL